MPEPAAKQRWTWRHWLRGCRITVLMLTLVAITAMGWLNEVGLPDFLKGPLVENLRARGVDLQFSRLRWRWYRGVVAENVRFGSAQPDPNAPQLAIREVELHLDHLALVKFKFKIDALQLRGGNLVWRLEETNQIPAMLAVTNIQAQLRLLPHDQWELDHFTAAFAGAKLHLSGSLTNASALRDWKIFHRRAGAPPELLGERLRALAQTLDCIKFAKPPELNVGIYGDAREVRSFNGLVTLDAPDADTPWGTLLNGALLVRLAAPGPTNALAQALFQLRADEVGTQWGSTKKFQLDLHAADDETATNVVRARLEISAAQFTTRWAQASNAHFVARWTHSLTNPVPEGGTAELRLAGAQTRWGNADLAQINASLSTPATNGPRQADASWGKWAAVEPYWLDWSCRVENLRADDFKAAQVVCGGSWRAPELTLTNLHSEMYQGQLNAGASLNVATRVAKFACSTDFDVQKATPFLTPGGRNWFRQQQFVWAKPPLARASGSVVLPAWTNARPDWSGVRPTLCLQGDFAVGAASFHTVPVSSAQSHFSYSNLVWNLPDLVATRPEGRLQLEMTADDGTSNYFFHIRSAVDVKILRGLLEPAGQRVLDQFTFTQPPVIDGEIWGRWHQYERTGGKAQLTVSNFTYRGEMATYAHGDLQYTNLFLLVTNGRVERTNQYGTATAVGFDFKGKRGFLTNGSSTLDPGAFLHTLGPKISQLMEPYHFAQPPTVQVNGVIPLSDDISVADMHFKINGGPYEWLKFRVPHVSGTVDWVGQGMTISGVQADFYKGKLTGSAGFDFRRKVGTDFKFNIIVTEAHLGELMADLKPGTNHLEGFLSGNLNVTQADSQDNKSWFGKGQVDLRDGLIWEFPIFGVVSPVLDKISPGLGKTRVKDATANFIITNSVIRSGDLELRSPVVRLLYQGTVDFGMNVDATVEADVGRDTPLLGPVFGTIFAPFAKLFETRVTGTLSDPKREPVQPMVRLLGPLLHPLRTLKEMWSGGESGADTNAVPVTPVNPSPH